MNIRSIFSAPPLFNYRYNYPPFTWREMNKYLIIPFGKKALRPICASVSLVRQIRRIGSGSKFPGAKVVSSVNFLLFLLFLFCYVAVQ